MKLCREIDLTEIRSAEISGRKNVLHLKLQSNSKIMIVVSGKPILADTDLIR
jgi:hypothetical protein